MEVLIDPAKVVFYHPKNLSAFKDKLFSRIGQSVANRGGTHIRHNVGALEKLSPDQIPLVGCMPECTQLIKQWRAMGRPWAYWDRGYARRVFATWLPRAPSIEKSYYRVHLNSFQLQTIRDLPDDRWKALTTDVTPWSKDGRHIVVAKPTPTYSRFHDLENWTERTITELKKHTDRKIITRDKEDKRPLQDDLRGAHALVAHGSIAAVEAVICGCPVFVCADSAAALVGRTDLAKIEEPIYPDRQAWLNSLAFSQFSEAELVDGTLWRMIT